MGFAMKTTLMIEDSVLRLAKQHAAARDTTVSEIVNQSLRTYLHSRETAATDVQPFSIPVYGKFQTHAPGVSPAQLADLRDDGR